MWILIFLFVQPCLSVGGRSNSPLDGDTSSTSSGIVTTASSSSRASRASTASITNDKIGTDLSCTAVDSTGNAIYSERATSCSNYWDDLQCKKEYGDGKIIGAQAGERNKRPEKCYQDNNSTVKRMATERCARFCGFCCELPEFKCENNPQDEMDCSTVTKQDCFDATKKAQLIEGCPNICGFCNLPLCVDSSPDCVYWDRNGNYCNSTGYTLAEKKRDCQLTCNLC